MPAKSYTVSNIFRATLVAPLPSCSCFWASLSYIENEWTSSNSSTELLTV
uniref:Uncharacterized protein n=1 Tax=Anguilla anguilla TaxID=7936 RepID=A0A0E9Y121_ANGAN